MDTFGEKHSATPRHDVAICLHIVDLMLFPSIFDRENLHIVTDMDVVLQFAQE